MDEEIRTDFLSFAAENLNTSVLEYSVKNTFLGWSAKDKMLMINEFKDIFNTLLLVIEAVEFYSTKVGNLTGKDKLNLAVDYIFYLLNTSKIFEWYEVAVLEYVICSIVFSNNLRYGHVWANEKK